MITKVRTRRRKFQLSEMNSELREMKFGLRELKFGLREINLSCEVLDSQSHRNLETGQVEIGINIINKKLQLSK